MKDKIQEHFLNGNKLKVSKFARKSYIEKNYNDIFLVVQEYTLNNKWIKRYSENIYCYMNDIQEQPKCKQCGSLEISFKQYSEGYANYCSNCSRSFKKGKKWEEFGKNPTETKRRMTEANQKRTGKTWTEIFGEEKTKKMKISIGLKLKGREFTKEWKEKISKSNKGRLVGNKNPMKRTEVVKKLQKTFEERGLKIPDSQLANFELYKRKVRELSESAFRKNFYSLINSKSRGDGFDLDHKFSIFEGFKQNLPAYLIGSIYNLEMMESKLNKSKGTDCSITKENLIKEFYNDNNGKNKTK